MLWTVSTFIMKAYVADSCHGVVLWFFQHRRVIDPRFSFCPLALTENRCLFHKLLPFTCASRCCLRLCSCLLEVGLQSVLDLAASPRLGHLYLSWHLCCNSTTVFCATLHFSFETLRHHIDKKFPGCPRSTWDIVRAELEMQIRLIFALK